jgi:hypothetical protein
MPIVKAFRDSTYTRTSTWRVIAQDLATKAIPLTKESITDLIARLTVISYGGGYAKS